MSKIYLYFLLFVAFISSDLIAQNQGYNVPSRKKKTTKEQAPFEADFELMLSFSYHTSSAYYNKNGDRVSDLLDSTTVEGLTRRFTFNLNRYMFDLGIKYFATDKLTLEAKAPLTFYKLDEIFTEFADIENQVIYPKEFRAQLSHTRVDYLGLSASYSLFEGDFINRYFAEVRIPTGQNNGVANDSQEFWSDGALEIIPGFVVGASTDKYTIEVGAKYDYRGEDMTNRVMGNLNFSLHTVPGTKFYGFVEGAYNVGMGNNDIINEVFNIRKMPWQDEYLDVGFGFKIIMSQQYIGDFSYRVRLDGRNAWNQSAYFINFGVSL